MKQVGPLFILFGLLSLVGGIFFGTVGALQFVFPEFFEDLPFFKSRPLHVSLVVSWIFLAAIGGIYHCLPTYNKLPLRSNLLSQIHLWTMLATGLIIMASYFAGKFGGREYWEFPPVLSIPIIISWLLFLINYFATVLKKKDAWPVYLWMWATGIFFFLYSFLEANAWLVPYFSENVVREITIQWKANGALVGSWNMLVYGTAIFLMERIEGGSKLALSKPAFLLFFLGFTNLLFGWAHHTYIVPAAPWIRHVAYFISMTELLILARIIWNWNRDLEAGRRHIHIVPYRFLLASNVWIGLNLVLAIIMSVPALNLYTHGTHITVAHAMGSTIGINSMILLASVFFLLKPELAEGKRFAGLHLGFWITNFSLLLFWVCLIGAGYTKGLLTMEDTKSFAEIMEEVMPWFKAVTYSGFGLLVGMLLILAQGIRSSIQFLQKKY